MAQVCIFNSVGAQAQFTINGGITPPVEPTSRSQNFVPHSLWVDLCKHIDPGTGVFGYGRNTFSVSFSDVDPKLEEKLNYSYVIELSPQEISLLDDLIIYAFRQSIMVMNKNGYPIESWLRKEVSKE